VKVLLLGDFSALHKNLQEGLQELGHEVVLASTGDGWKAVERDIDLSMHRKGTIGKVLNRLDFYKKISAFSGFDVVQIINAGFFPQKIFPLKFVFDGLKRKNGKIFLLAAGDDSFFWRYGRKRLKYGPFNDFLKYDLKATTDPSEKYNYFKKNKYIADSVNGIIPIMYEYEKSYEGHLNLLQAIPIPINISKIDYRPNVVKQKIVIFHGLNRYGFKGTRFVEEAFSILRARYTNDLELIIDGKMSLSKYLDLMSRTNIVIDQVWSHSCGVNAIYALAMGKIVLGGAEPESLKSLGLVSSPVINIKPDVNNIVSIIEGLLEQRESFEELGFASRLFAEKVHSHIKIAEKYLSAWGNA